LQEFNNRFILRPALPGDETAIHGLITELAVFEKEPLAVINTPHQIKIDLFQTKVCFAFVVEDKNLKEVIAFSLYFFSYSTWKGKCVYLEDLYVKESYRSEGIGQILFDAVVAVAREQKVARMDWQVLDWNAPAIKFYRKNKAVLDPSWINGRLFFYL
jgi:GNAT superfamily N-acetyltransferase